MDGVTIISEDYVSRALVETLQRNHVPVVIGLDLASGPDQDVTMSHTIGLRPAFVIGEDPGALEIEPSPPRYGNPRPYLKRKKGRS